MNYSMTYSIIVLLISSVFLYLPHSVYANTAGVTVTNPDSDKMLEDESMVLGNFSIKYWNGTTYNIANQTVLNYATSDAILQLIQADLAGEPINLEDKLPEEDEQEETSESEPEPDNDDNRGFDPSGPIETIEPVLNPEPLPENPSPPEDDGSGDTGEEG